MSCLLDLLKDLKAGTEQMSLLAASYVNDERPTRLSCCFAICMAACVQTKLSCTAAAKDFSSQLSKAATCIHTPKQRKSSAALTHVYIDMLTYSTHLDIKTHICHIGALT